MTISDDDLKALEGFAFAAQLAEKNVQLGVEGPYAQYDFAAHLERWMTAHGFTATAGACFSDLLDELSAQVLSGSRN